MKFYDYAKNITNEQMQNLWAKIFSTEIDNPESISLSLSLLHTISIIRPNQAETINNIARFSLQDGKTEDVHPLIFILKNRNAYEKMGININDLKGLERLGIIECDLINEFIFERKKRFRYGNKEIVVYGDINSKEKIQCGNVKFTEDGQSVYKLISSEYKDYNPQIIDFIV